MALDMARKISFKPTSRRSSHVRTARDRLARHWTRDCALQSICPGDTGFRHPQAVVHQVSPFWWPSCIDDSDRDPGPPHRADEVSHVLPEGSGQVRDKLAAGEPRHPGRAAQLVRPGAPGCRLGRTGRGRDHCGRDDCASCPGDGCYERNSPSYGPVPPYLEAVAVHLPGVVVGAEPVPARVPHAPVRGPLAERDLADQAGFYPVRSPRIPGGSGVPNGLVSRCNGPSCRIRSASIASVKPVPTFPAYSSRSSS